MRAVIALAASLPVTGHPFGIPARTRADARVRAPGRP
jgi:hypothetical protein